MNDSIIILDSIAIATAQLRCATLVVQTTKSPPPLPGAEGVISKQLALLVELVGRPTPLRLVANTGAEVVECYLNLLAQAGAAPAAVAAAAAAVRTQFAEWL